MKTNTKSVSSAYVSAPRTHEGAPAKRITPLLELRRSVLATMLWEKGFYESGQKIADRIQGLIKAVKPEKVAALAREARTAGKLRHVPLWIARGMAPLPEHRAYVSGVLKDIVQRPDELAEFISLYWQNGKQPLSNQVKKGLAAAFTKFDEYALAKYNRDADIKLRDVLFLVHAKPVDKEQGQLWKKLIGGFCAKCWGRENEHKGKRHEFVEAKLTVPDTWEVALSASEGENKKEAWEKLLRNEKLGALALIRNLRNFKECGVDESLVRQALKNMRTEKVLPYRFITAAKYAPSLEPELEEAMFKCLGDKSKLGGKTVLLIDVSGSMDEKISDKSEARRIDAASGLAILARELCENVEVYTFSYNSVQVPTRRGFALRDAIVKSQPHGGTDLGGALTQLKGQVPNMDRLIVFTDEQSHTKVGNPPQGVIGYMINVANNQYGVGYGAWNHIDGFSESILDYIVELEKLLAD